MAMSVMNSGRSFDTEKLCGCSMILMDDTVAENTQSGAFFVIACSFGYPNSCKYHQTLFKLNLHVLTENAIIFLFFIGFTNNTVSKLLSSASPPLLSLSLLTVSYRHVCKQKLHTNIRLTSRIFSDHGINEPRLLL